MAEYFGNNSTSAPTNTSVVNKAVMAKVAVSGQSMVCPGSGAQTLLSLEAYVRNYSGGSGSIRVALYNTDGDLVVEGYAAVASPAAYAWTGHTTFTWHNGYTTLTGGETYWFVVAGGDGSNMIVGGASGSSGDSQSIATDYSGGLPDPWPAATNITLQPGIRASVEAAGGGSSPSAYYAYAQQ